MGDWHKNQITRQAHFFSPCTNFHRNKNEVTYIRYEHIINVIVVILHDTQWSIIVKTTTTGPKRWWFSGMMMMTMMMVKVVSTFSLDRLMHRVDRNSCKLLALMLPSQLSSHPLWKVRYKGLYFNDVIRKDFLLVSLWAMILNKVCQFGFPPSNSPQNVIQLKYSYGP